jgi:GNAT superfamily N-acetyltransferase
MPEPVPNSWLLTELRTYPTARRQGLAKEVMHQIIVDADLEGAVLLVSAQAQPNDNKGHPGLSQTQLEAFYKRFGFKVFIESEPWCLIRK